MYKESRMKNQMVILGLKDVVEQIIFINPSIYIIIGFKLTKKLECGLENA